MKIELTKIIKEGNPVPFWYGIVGLRPECLYGVEVGIIPYNFIKRFWYWSLQKSQLPKWQRIFLEREEEVRSKAFKHGVEVGLKQARHQPEMRELYKDIAKEGMKNGLDVFQYRHLPDDELRTKIDEIATNIAKNV